MSPWGQGPRVESSDLRMSQAEARQAPGGGGVLWQPGPESGTPQLWDQGEELWWPLPVQTPGKGLKDA